MKTLLTILLLFALANIFGQSTVDNKYRLPKKVFESHLYKRSVYQRFDGQIEDLGNSCFKFGDKILYVSVENTTLLEIFKNGVFNPDIFFGKETTHKDKAELDTLSQNQKTAYNLTRNDTLSVCCFEELVELNPNIRTKRFKFWLFRIGVADPTEYYLELYNDKSTRMVTLKEFLVNSTMTFYYWGTIII
jgi:hypothetical protein